MNPPTDAAASHPRPNMEEEEEQASKRVRGGGGDARSHHSESKYRNYTPNFAALARQYPETFGYFVTYLDADKTDAVINWDDPKAARALTQTLLHHDFGLTWEIPLERLCPPVPNRLNYICWIKDLLRLGGNHTHTQTYAHTHTRGLDIGTGASVIYPLLGATVYGWNFLATDIDKTALEAARVNVEKNNLQGKISLKLVPRADYSDISLSSSSSSSSPVGPILAALQGGEGHGEEMQELDFVMCNPPFFGSLTEIHLGSVEKDDPTPVTSSSSFSGPGLGGAGSGSSNKRVTNTATTHTHTSPAQPHGCMDEMITPGGELAFVTAIIKDSLLLQTKCKWYTSMVGKKSTLRKLLSLLRRDVPSLTNIHTTEFLQGRTTRWGIAWSFSQDGLAELQGAGAKAHKVFGRKKMDKKRETIDSFLVKPLTPTDNLTEAVVLQRVMDYFVETKQVCVVRVGVAAGGAEELYRKVVVCELSGGEIGGGSGGGGGGGGGQGHTHIQGQDPGEGRNVSVVESGFAVPPIVGSDPEWKRKCVVLVTVLAGAAAAEEEEGGEEGVGGGGKKAKGGEEMEVEENGGGGGEKEKHWVKVTVEMTSGGDRGVFWKLCGLMPGEVGRTNRKWRRKLQQQHGSGGGGGEGGGGGGGATMG